MKKYLFKIVALSGMLSYGVAHSQVLPNHENNQKVYVSKNGGAYQAPTRTLDVGGAVRLETPGEPVDGSVPLAIANDGQVVIQNLSSSTSSFATKRYFIKVKDPNGETKVDSEAVIIDNLGIDYNKYIPVLLNYKLMRLKKSHTDATNMDNLEVPPIAVQSLTKGTAGGPDNYRVVTVGVAYGRSFGVIPGNIVDITIPPYSQWEREDEEWAFQAIPRVLIRDHGDHYGFTADWRDTGDSLYNAENYWVIDVLLINKNNLSGNATEVIKKQVVRPNQSGSTTLGNTWQLQDY